MSNNVRRMGQMLFFMFLSYSFVFMAERFVEYQRNSTDCSSLKDTQSNKTSKWRVRLFLLLGRAGVTVVTLRARKKSELGGPII
jgi:hypothetical protein